MRIIAIDPGPVESAWVVHDRVPVIVDKCENAALVTHLESCFYDLCIIEKVESMGMAVGKETFETVYWSGIFAHAFGIQRVRRVTRREVKLHMCGSMLAKDANIRAALGDRFGGESAYKKGGALYKMNNDERSALAVALTWLDTADEAREANRG